MFIATVLVTAIAAGVLINTAGFLQSPSEQTGERSSQQVTDRLEPVSKTENVDTTTTVNTVSIVFQKAPGASDINVSSTTFELIGPGGKRPWLAGRLDDRPAGERVLGILLTSRTSRCGTPRGRFGARQGTRRRPRGHRNGHLLAAVDDEAGVVLLPPGADVRRRD